MHVPQSEKRIVQMLIGDFFEDTAFVIDLIFSLVNVIVESA